MLCYYFLFNHIFFNLFNYSTDISVYPGINKELFNRFKQRNIWPKCQQYQKLCKPLLTHCIIHNTFSYTAQIFFLHFSSHLTGKKRILNELFGQPSGKDIGFIGLENCYDVRIKGGKRKVSEMTPRYLA